MLTESRRGKYFEDFEVGYEFTTPARTITPEMSAKVMYRRRPQ